MKYLLCEWCKTTLQKAGDRPTLCVYCYDHAAGIEQEWFGREGAAEVEPEVKKSKPRTTPDCRCGGETFDAGNGNWRCLECGIEQPKEVT